MATIKLKQNDLRRRIEEYIAWVKEDTEQQMKLLFQEVRNDREHWYNRSIEHWFKKPEYTDEMILKEIYKDGLYRWEYSFLDGRWIRARNRLKPLISLCNEPSVDGLVELNDEWSYIL